MEANLGDTIGLPAIAATTGLSVGQFARQFRSTTGKAPHQFLLQLRIARSEQLLRDTDTSIAEIAYACGFASQEHLTRMLRRSRGHTPAKYRKDIRS
jgi:AraC family transcriptional regulator